MIHAVLLFLNLLSLSNAFSQEKPEHRVVVISDLNGSYGSTAYGKEVDSAISIITSMNPDLVLATGDLVAGQKEGLDYRAMWKSFHQRVTIPLEKNNIPLAVAVGNHDGSAFPRYLQERQIFMDEWKQHIPRVRFSSSELYPVFYSFESGDRLFVALDTTRVGPLSKDQLTWIEQELLRHQDRKQIIFFAHVPLFHFADINLNESYFDEGLMNLIQKYHVKLFMSGHHHSYYPGFHEGTHFVSQSCLGSGPTQLIGRKNISEKSFTVVDFYSEHFEVYALKAPLFLERIDHRTLPAEITSKGKTLKLKAISYTK